MWHDASAQRKTTCKTTKTPCHRRRLQRQRGRPRVVPRNHPQESGGRLSGSSPVCQVSARRAPQLSDASSLDPQTAWFVAWLGRFHEAFHDRCVSLAPDDEPRKLTPTRFEGQRWWKKVLEALGSRSALFAVRPGETSIGTGCRFRGLPFRLRAADGHSTAALSIESFRDPCD